MQTVVYLCNQIRAFSYFNLAQLYEYQTTGYPSLDEEAKAKGVYGLTVPIITEKTTKEESYHNPRVPFYRMYRFILTDLNRADSLLSGNTRADINQANTAVIYGLKVRFWLTLASRFDNTPSDLDSISAHANDANCAGYDKLGITSARQCSRQWIGSRKEASRRLHEYIPLQNYGREH